MIGVSPSHTNAIILYSPPLYDFYDLSNYLCNVHIYSFVSVYNIAVSLYQYFEKLKCQFLDALYLIVSRGGYHNHLMTIVVSLLEVFGLTDFVIIMKCWY